MNLAPVVWREGMHLAQHHFQLRDRYFGDSAHFSLETLFFGAYGLTGLELDHEALLNGSVSIVHARGVMPDGLCFSFPDDPSPPPLSVGERFSPSRQSHVVSLAIPPYRAGRANCVLEAAQTNGNLRYSEVTKAVADETTGGDERAVTLGRKNFRLVLDTDDMGDLVTLPLARVQRDRSGSLVYDPNHVPPCLQISGSHRILDLLRRLSETLVAKARTLSADRGGAGEGAEWAPDEIVGFWLSHAIHTNLAVLRHHLRGKSSHPEAVVRDLLRLAGALSTFALESRVEELPRYEHDNLETTLSALEGYIETHLKVVLPAKPSRLPLRPMEEDYFRRVVADPKRPQDVEWFREAQHFFFRAEVSDERSLRDAHWFLGVRSEAPKARVVEEIPRLVKICSARHIVRLVRSAHPALGLEHLAHPPVSLSRRPGTEYFAIKREGPCWNSIVETVEVGLYAPEALVGHRLEVVIVPDPEA